MLKVAVAGVAGRMGRALVQAVVESQNSNIKLSAAVQRPGSSLLGADVGELAAVGRLGIPVVATLAEADFDLLIDFTTIESSLSNIRYCAENSKRMVIGTTGFTEAQKQEISSAGARIPIVFAANMSVGMNLCFHLLKQMSEVLAVDSDI